MLLNVSTFAKIIAPRKTIHESNKADVEDSKVDHVDILDPIYWNSLSPDKLKVLVAKGKILLYAQILTNNVNCNREWLLY